MTPEQKQAVRALVQEILAEWAEDQRFIIDERYTSTEEYEQWEASDEAQRTAYRTRLEAILAEAAL